MILFCLLLFLDDEHHSRSPLTCEQHPDREKSRPAERAPSQAEAGRDHMNRVERLASTSSTSRTRRWNNTFHHSGLWQLGCQPLRIPSQSSTTSDLLLLLAYSTVIAFLMYPWLNGGDLLVMLLFCRNSTFVSLKDSSSISRCFKLRNCHCLPLENYTQAWGESMAPSANICSGS